MLLSGLNIFQLSSESSSSVVEMLLEELFKERKGEEEVRPWSFSWIVESCLVASYWQHRTSSSEKKWLFGDGSSLLYNTTLQEGTGG